MNAVTEVMDELRKALAELEDCRARNADLRTMLEQVTRERDEARAACPDCAMWAERSARWHDDMQRAERERDEWRDKFLALNQTAGELCNACGWAFKIPGEPCRCEVVRERDEARADAERYLADLRRCASEPYERTRELEALQAEVERLRTEVASSLAMASAEADVLRGFGCMEDGDGPCGVCRECFYRHGYRRGAEAMREACARWMSEREGISQWVYDDMLSALPIPEEK